MENIFRLQDKAIQEVQRAIAEGTLPNLKTTPTACVDCGRPARHYDHRDYDKPLEVEPVCVKCNQLRGPAEGYDSRLAEQQRSQNRLVRLRKSFTYQQWE